MDRQVTVSLDVMAMAIWFLALFGKKFFGAFFARELPDFRGPKTGASGPKANRRGNYQRSGPHA
jgi:hypothetical protein